MSGFTPGEDSMDTKTLKSLVAEAKKNEKRAAAAWRKDDNSDDMHEMEMWDAAVAWLTAKLP